MKGKQRDMFLLFVYFCHLQQTHDCKNTVIQEGGKGDNICVVMFASEYTCVFSTISYLFLCPSAVVLLQKINLHLDLIKKMIEQ